MAANNYAIVLTDGGDSGNGPYTVQAYKNPAYSAGGVGGTANWSCTPTTSNSFVFQNDAGLNTKSMLELLYQMSRFLIDDIATTQQSDTAN
jgi:hypothetical protein